MDLEQTARNVYAINKGREKYHIERIGGYCPHVDLDSPFSLVLAGYQRDLAGVSDYIRNYPFYRLGYTTQGKILLNDTKKDYILTGGTFYAFKPGETSTAKSLGNANWHHYILNINGSQAGVLLNNTGLLQQRVITVKDQNAAETIMRAILDESLKSGTNSQQICEHYLKILLLSLPDWLVSINDTRQSDYQTFMKCKNVFDRDFTSLVSIEQIAQSCDISQQHLSRIFKKYLNITPLNYLVKLKMNRAAVFLLETDFSIAQIAQVLSFNDQFYFSKVFKKIYGISPIEYRSSIRNKLKISHPR